MALVPTDRLYITANFKETQLTKVRVGQPADIEADIYPGFIYKAHVEFDQRRDRRSIRTAAAGKRHRQLGQSRPARAGKDRADQPPPADKPLRMGLSIEVTVDISDTSDRCLPRRCKASISMARFNSKAPAANKPAACVNPVIYFCAPRTRANRKCSTSASG